VALCHLIGGSHPCIPFGIKVDTEHLLLRLDRGVHDAVDDVLAGVTIAAGQHTTSSRLLRALGFHGRCGQ
jgi:hypothetical protein